MPRGPLPNPQRRRRNAPTIPTTNLPAGGRKGAPPECPLEIADAGARWWAWAWATPQAAAWDDGQLYVIARRAQLEDDVATLDTVEGLDLDLVLDAEELVDVRFVVKRLAALVTGRATILREQRELDDRLGLTPKATAALRWRIVAEEPTPIRSRQARKSSASSGRAKLRPVL